MSYGRCGYDTTETLVWRTLPSRMLNWPTGVGVFVNPQTCNLRRKPCPHDFVNSTPKKSKKVKVSTPNLIPEHGATFNKKLPFTSLFQIPIHYYYENFGYFLIMYFVCHQNSQEIYSIDVPILETTFCWNMLYPHACQFTNAKKNASKKYKGLNNKLPMYDSTFYTYNFYENCDCVVEFKKLLENYFNSETDQLVHIARIMKAMSQYYVTDMGYLINATRIVHNYVITSFSEEDQSNMNINNFWSDSRISKKVAIEYRKEAKYVT